MIAHGKTDSFLVGNDASLGSGSSTYTASASVRLHRMIDIGSKYLSIVLKAELPPLQVAQTGISDRGPVSGRPDRDACGHQLSPTSGLHAHAWPLSTTASRRPYSAARPRSLRMAVVLACSCWQTSGIPQFCRAVARPARCLRGSRRH
jgi:hypothetical protein